MYNQYSNVAEELSRLHLNNASPQRYSPGGGKKVGPEVPPKPKKSGGVPHSQMHILEDDCGQALYGNIGVVQSVSPAHHAGVEDYYAVNAPAPGTVGVASARINHAYTGGGGAEIPAGREFSGIVIPGAVYTSSTAQANTTTGGGMNPLNPDFTPPPPQPAHSYTPASRKAVQMSAQPLYSNTASQPIYNNSPRPQQTSQQRPGQYSRGDHSPPPPLPSQPPPNQAQSGGPTYANLSTNGSAHYHLYANVDNSSGVSQYTSYGPDEDFPLPPPDEGPPPPSPPSPVSSSYSELRRATPSSTGAHPQQHHNGAPPQHHLQQQQQQQQQSGSGYATYAPQSHTSSTYESIYEPITPRPSSQMSNKSGYSLYGPYTSPRARGLAPAPTNQPLLNPDKVGKEAEVDALTNLLVQSMDSTNDPEFFGAYDSCICTRCGEKVVGEGSGCTAMEQVYHIKCFVCIVCHLQLQGKPFYALDSKPYCEDCYLNTLEKCCVCTKPILDRILRATGKPYHPQCFTCVVCNKSLDGIPFTVDASNQIHCIDDFHKKFAPRCTVCKEPIMPEPGKDETVRVVALDRSFHVNCYKCEDCGLVLSSEAEGRGCYPLDGHVLCKSCNARRVQAITSKVTTDL